MGNTVAKAGPTGMFSICLVMFGAVFLFGGIGFLIGANNAEFHPESTPDLPGFTPMDWNKQRPSEAAR